MTHAHYSLLLIAFLTLSHPAYALLAGKSLGAVNSARENCEKAVSDSSKGCSRKTREMLERYPKDLASLERTVKRRGELENLVLVRKEIERFKNDGVIDVSHVLNGFDDLEKLQLRYAALSMKLEADKLRQILDAFDRCSVRLIALEDDLKKKGSAGEADSVRDERLEILSSEENTRAEFELAEIEMQKPALETALAKYEKKKPVTTRRPVKKVTGWEEFGGDDAVVYPHGTPSSRFQKGEYKDVSRTLVHTDRLRVQKNQLGIAMSQGEEKSQYRKKVWRYGKQVDARFPTTVTRTFCRIEIAGRSGNSRALKPTLLVTYFSNKIGSRRESEAQIDVIRIPNIQGRSRIVIDTRGLKTATDIKTYEDGDRGERRVTVGNEFHSLILSLFDGDGKLVLQAVTDRVHMNNLPTQLPE